MPKKLYLSAIGRRKTATATVRLYKGSDKSKVNKKEISEYFSENPKAEEIFSSPLQLCGLLGKYSITVKVRGGGKIAQIEAIRLGIARAIAPLKDEYKQTLRKENLLTRDPREKERKKPGLKRARRAPQWQKR